MTAIDKKARSSTDKSEAKNVSSDKSERADTDKATKKFWSDPWKYVLRFRILLPYVLPSADTDVCLRYVGVLLCSIFRRGLNVLVPAEVGRIVDVLEEGLPLSKVWNRILFLIFLKFLNSGSGIAVLENFLWRPIETKAHERLDIAAYEHLMSLSSDYHDNKKSAAVWEGVRAGRSAVQLISLFSFDLMPRVLDAILSMSVLWTKYDRKTATIAAATMIAYNWISLHTQSKRRGRIRRQIDSRGQEANILAETSTNWSTVAYFNRFEHEKNRYREAVRSTQQSQQEDRYTFMGWSAAQQVITLLGMGSACLVIAEQIQDGHKKPSEFVVFTTYWAQLMGPMMSFVSIFLLVSRTLFEAEKLIEIFEMQPSVKQDPDAHDIEVRKGEIVFGKVAFGYNKQRQILRNVSFKCIPGQTTAFVGDTGGGKSTVLKLITRLYDATSGTVAIDGQDVKKVTLDSLRSLFGVVPQNIGVFNTSILENLRYGKLDASLEDCQVACKAAALHERILQFPDGYDTVVGEKGVKLSGGELQRLALARVVLKDPRILILDEATSSVDTATEAMIQDSLKKVSAGRTTIVVAHRLSTIAHADQILVMSDGAIVEHGNHETLLAQKGLYHKLWTRQDDKVSSNVSSNVKALQRAKSCPLLKNQ